MEQQVGEAALAMVRSSTEGATRTAASRFLEHWNMTPGAWEVYAKWLQSFRQQHQYDSSDSIGLQLLCLTLLQAKIRREVPRGTTPNDALLAIRQELGSFVLSRQQQQQLQQQLTLLHSSVMTAVCICIATLAARCGDLNHVIGMCRTAMSANALRILASIPLEVEACADLRSFEVIQELWPYLELVLDTIRLALGREETMLPALEALKNWNSICHVTMSQLNTPTLGGTDSLLPQLLRILSASHPTRPEILVAASQALTEAILIPSDSCTRARHAAAATLLDSIGSHGFASAPLQYATQHDWEDAAHALATMVCTLVTEEIEDFCTLPAEPCLHLLLEIQSHPHTPVALAAMECWLTVQEMPASDRHEHWKAPLFTKIVEGILSRIAYPNTFTTWQRELDVDESEFEEMRRMVTDVLISSYFLLRIQFVQMMASAIMTAPDWTLAESALFCLSQVAREVCARIKARAGGSSVSADRDATAQQLLQLGEQLCGIGAESAARQHPLVLSGVCKFVGAYAPAWNVKCSPEALLQLLAYLRAAMQKSGVDASKATRAILIQCSSRLLECDQNQILNTFRETLDAALSTENEEVTTLVAEGLTRLSVQIKDESFVRDALANLVGPLLQRTETALEAVPVGNGVQQPTHESEAAVQSLARYLSVLKVVIQFCETCAPISDVIASIWPILEKTAPRVAQHEFLLDPLLAIHEQLLRNASAFVAPYLEQTIKFVVHIFEAYKHPTALEYIAGAIEAFGASNVESFKELLGHVSVNIFGYFTTAKRPQECPDIIRAFFEMNKRYVLYCPTALVCCQQFPTIVSMAVDCLTSCQGERESTRSILNFLTQLFGWRLLRLDDIVIAALEASSGVVDEQLTIHGGAVTRSCVSGLLGGPTMLWPAYSDCLFAIIHVVVTKQSDSSPHETPLGQPHHHYDNSTTLAHQWMYEAQQDSNLPQETYQQVVSILAGLARNGPKSKPKAKMLLTDFAKIAKGEMTPDALVSYSLA